MHKKFVIIWIPKYRQVVKHFSTKASAVINPGDTIVSRGKTFLLGNFYN